MVCQEFQKGGVKIAATSKLKVVEMVEVVKELTVILAKLMGEANVVQVHVTVFATLETAVQEGNDVTVSCQVMSPVHVNGISMINLPSVGMAFFGESVNVNLDLDPTELALAEIEHELKVPETNVNAVEQEGLLADGP